LGEGRKCDEDMCGYLDGGLGRIEVCGRMVERELARKAKDSYLPKESTPEVSKPSNLSITSKPNVYTPPWRIQYPIYVQSPAPVSPHSNKPSPSQLTKHSSSPQPNPNTSPDSHSSAPSSHPHNSPSDPYPLSPPHSRASYSRSSPCVSAQCCASSPQHTRWPWAASVCITPPLAHTLATIHTGDEWE
jgi:hypothetical protein